MKKLTTSERLRKRMPLEVYATADRSWIWEIYKHYRKPEHERSNPYARVFCRVLSPIVGYTDGEMGDVYINEIERAATKVYDESEGKYDLEAIRKVQPERAVWLQFPYRKGRLREQPPSRVREMSERRISIKFANALDDLIRMMLTKTDIEELNRYYRRTTIMQIIEEALEDGE